MTSEQEEKVLDLLDEIIRLNPSKQVKHIVYEIAIIITDPMSYVNKY